MSIPYLWGKVRRQGGVEGPDPGSGKFRVGRFDHVGPGEVFPNLTLFRLFPDEVDDPGGVGRRQRIRRLLPPGGLGERGRFVYRNDRVVAGHGRIGGLELAESFEDRLRLAEGPLPDGRPKAFQGFQVAGLLEGVHALLLELPGLGEDQGPDGGGIVGKEDLLEPDAGVGGFRVGRTPRECVLGRLELLPVGLFHGTALDEAVGEAARLHQGDVRPRRNAPVHDEGGFGEGHSGKGAGKQGVETVEDRDEGFGFGLISRIDAARDGASRPVHDEREADEGTVAPLLLGVSPAGESIAPAGSLEIGIAHVVEKNRLRLPCQRLAVLHQTPLDDLFHAPETVGDGVKGILSDLLEPPADHLRQARPAGEPAVGGKIASGGHEASDDDGTGQAEFPAGEPGGKEDLIQAQLLPGGIGGDLGTGRATVLHLDGVGSQNGRSPGTGGHRIGSGAPLLPVELVLPDGRLDDGQEFRIRKTRKDGLPRKTGGEQVGQGLSPGGIEGKSSQVEQDPVARALVRLDGLDELMGDIDRSGLFVPDAGFPNVHEGSLSESALFHRHMEPVRKKAYQEASAMSSGYIKKFSCFFEV